MDLLKAAQTSSDEESLGMAKAAVINGQSKYPCAGIAPRMRMELQEQGQAPCCVKGCSDTASLTHKAVGQFWEYSHNYCSDHYTRLLNGDPDIELDMQKVPLVRLSQPTRPWASQQ